MSVVLFLSPHLDDAVFSCPGRILTEVRRGARVIVATLFSHCGRHTASRPEYRNRRQEDCRALRLLGAERMWLGLPDAPFRAPYYQSFRTIIFGQSPSDHHWLAKIQERLTSLIADLRPRRIYAPLGVGHHIDHRLTFRAAAASCERRKIIFYEERPYALLPHAVAWRLAQLGSPANQTDRHSLDAAYWRSLLRATYVRSYLPSGPERRRTREEMSNATAEPGIAKARWRSETQAWSGSDLATLTAAIFAYQSQAPSFLGPRESYVRSARRHARSLGFQSDWAETIWRA